MGVWIINKEYKMIWHKMMGFVNATRIDSILKYIFPSMPRYKIVKTHFTAMPCIPHCTEHFELQEQMISWVCKVMAFAYWLVLAMGKTLLG